MTESRVLLLTGFEPFGGFAQNPSWDALEFAYARGMFKEPDLPAGVRVEICRIPVVFNSAFDVLKQALDIHRPLACISFGVHGGMGDREQDVLYLESTARNRDGSTKADNAGRIRPEQSIVAEGSQTIAATLPLQKIRQRLIAGGFRTEISDDAGNYLCNHLFYRGAHALGGRIPYGFVHVPPVGESISLQRLAQAVVMIAGEAALDAQ